MGASAVASLSVVTFFSIGAIANASSLEREAEAGALAFGHKGQTNAKHLLSFIADELPSGELDTSYEEGDNLSGHAESCSLGENSNSHGGQWYLDGHITANAANLKLTSAAILAEYPELDLIEATETYLGFTGYNSEYVSVEMIALSTYKIVIYSGCYGE